MISGGTNDIDIEDLRQNTTLGGGYKKNDPFVKEFWSFLTSLDQKHKELFISFCTGTSRPPLLGFKYMNPKFCVHRVLVEDFTHPPLPTASTCMNMFKLPHYGDVEKMKKNIIIAIESEAGFGLE